MLKQSSSGRYQKGRGYYSRGKLALQVSLLLAICIWLVYQATQFSNQKAASLLIKSSDNKEIAGDLQSRNNGHRMLNLGRKNLDPRSELDNQATSDSQKPHDGDQETETSEDDESGAGNDDSGSGTQEKSEEGEQLEDLIDEDDTEV